MPVIRNSLDAIRYVEDITDTVVLSYSAGKDSLAAWLRLREDSSLKIIPVYHYMIPDLDFVESYLTYIEEYFNTRILRLPHPRLTWWLNYGTYMPPAMARQMIYFDFPVMTYESFVEDVIAFYDLTKNTWLALGTTEHDSANRRLTFRQHGMARDFNRKLFPIGDYTKTDVLKLLGGYPLKLPVDYRIWRRSWDGIDYFYLKGVRDHFPSDYRRIVKFFPLIELEFTRYQIGVKHGQIPSKAN